MALLYHSDDDLIEVRPNVFGYGVTDFENQMEESESIINRVLDAKWYRLNAKNAGVDPQADPFDSSKVLTTTQIRRLAVYKSLQLIYLYLMKESRDPDVFERQSNTFKKMYTDELAEVLTAGIDYDWDESGQIDESERSVPRVRRLLKA